MKWRLSEQPTQLTGYLFGQELLTDSKTRALDSSPKNFLIVVAARRACVMANDRSIVRNTLMPLSVSAV